MCNCDNGIRRLGVRHWWNVFDRLFVSKGLLMFLFVAPICWAFLPFAYNHIKGTDELIKANPLFLVFERMGVSCLLMFALMLAFAAILAAFRPIPRIRKFGDECLAAVADIRNVWRARIWWLVLLAVFYSAARICEMAFILGYKWTKITGASLSAVKDYGYFMGLMLALPLGFVASWFWKLQSHKGPELAARIDAYGLRGKTTTLSSVAFGICVAFLTLTSGLLYICAEEPCHVWGDICLMTLIACGVAVLTNLGAGCKSMGKLVDERCGSPTFAAILLSSIGVNFVMSALTAVIAFCGAVVHIWIQQNGFSGTLTTIWELFGRYWHGKGFILALWVAVGLCASVIAPIAQLIGVNLHDKEKSELSRYGVCGSDWLVICGGFEPLFVAVLMFIAVNYLGGVDAFKLCWDHESSMNSNLLMAMAVLTVVVIAIVKIAEVWGDKNSVIRNALFRLMRGSSEDLHANDTIESHYIRAMTLSLLKLYDKREVLVRQKVWMEGCVDIAALKNQSVPNTIDGRKVFLSSMVNGDDYFTTDDPFTADVLKAHEKWCEAVTGGKVSSMSLKRFLKKYALQAFVDGWADLKQQALSSINYSSGCKERAMPFVILANDRGDAKEYLASWNQLLSAISDSITNRKVVGQVNNMICDFSPEIKDSKSLSGATDEENPKKASRHRLWRFFVGAQRFCSLFMAREILFLIGVFVVIWVICFFCHLGDGVSNESAVRESFRSLFTLNLEANSLCRKVLSGLCFFVVWLIGGGVLVSVMVMQHRRNASGEFRLWFSSLVLRNHVVFLGWDENVLALIRRDLHKNPNRKVFIIVTMHNTEDVEKAAVATGIDKAKLLIYRGYYDDDQEHKRLNVKAAESIYIMGEGREEAHDSRVVLLVKNMRALVSDPVVRVYANLSDFGLASKLLAGGSKSSLHGVDFINFHLDSADAMLERRLKDQSVTNMAVIGFGAMGKAVAVKMLEKQPSISIDITDDDTDKLAMEKDRFDKLFPDYAGRVRRCQYLDCLAKLGSADNKERWLVVIAKHRSEKGLGIVWDVLATIKSKPGFDLVLNQEVKCDSWDLQAKDFETQDYIEIDGRKIWLFGFKRGDWYMCR